VRLLKWLFGIALIFFTLAMVAHHWLRIGLLAFIASGVALIALSKIMGDATEQLSHRVGQNIAGFVNVTLGNLAELIVVYILISQGMIDLVQANIVGSIFGNLLFVMGLSVLVGCWRHGTLPLNPFIVTLHISQLFLVGLALFLPTIVNAHLPEASQQAVSNRLAVLLVVVYIGSFFLFLKDKRLEKVKAMAAQLDQDWPLTLSLPALSIAAVATFFMGETLVAELEAFSIQFDLSRSFIGFIILPFLTNIAEHFSAIQSAWKNMPELSLAVAVGSATQVGMVVAPMAVVFGILTGHPMTLQFSQIPFAILMASFIAAYIVLRDNQWNLTEGLMLLASYSAMVITFWYIQ